MSCLGSKRSNLILKASNAEVKKAGGREGDRSRIIKIRDKFEVSTNISCERGINSVHCREEKVIEVEGATGFEVDVEDLKWRMGTGQRRISAQLNMTSGDGRKRNVRATIKFLDERGVNDNGTSMIYI